MGFCLIAASSVETYAGYFSGGLQAALGLGLVIFVHELGHFAVAKWCNVQCDRFYVGFDVPFGRFINWLMGKPGEFTLFGLKVPRTIGPPIKWGETEYGIGIVPLGGYVMMLGQTDDPSDFAEEQKRSKALEGSPDAKEIVGPNGEPLWVHRRSYRAKSVPQRMAIISAGVIMNVIFAFIFAFIAFGIGVPQLSCVVGSTVPGGAAWEANLRTGDRVVRIGDVENPTFNTLQSDVTLGDLEQGVVFDIERPDGSLIEGLTLVPKQVGALPQVGVGSSFSLRIAEDREPSEHTPAGQIDEGFEGGDMIIEVDGQPVSTYAELAAAQQARRGQAITYTVVRGGRPPADDPFGTVEGGKPTTVTVPPNPRERLGIVPRLGPVEAIQPDSPAAAAGLRVGDELVAINGASLGAAPSGETTWDPMSLDERLAEVAASGETAIVTVRRGEETIDLPVTPRTVAWIERPSENSPMGVPALGVACDVAAEVVALAEGSPAQRADLRPGDRIVAAELQAGEKKLTTKPIPFSEAKPNWPLFVSVLQDRAPDTKVLLTVVRGDDERQVELAIEPASNSFTLDQGLPLEPMQELRAASSLGEQSVMAWNSTQRSLTQVVRFLSKIGRQVPVGALGGPLTIVQQGFFSARDGVGSLLLFLTMLSANLAVLNFLPIPMLDGGHMVFLIWEGVRGRPANERFVVAMHLLGMAFLLSLMLFVFGLDLGLIDRGL